MDILEVYWEIFVEVIVVDERSVYPLQGLVAVGLTRGTMNEGAIPINKNLW